MRELNMNDLAGNYSGITDGDLIVSKHFCINKDGLAISLTEQDRIEVTKNLQNSNKKLYAIDYRIMLGKLAVLAIN